VNTEKYSARRRTTTVNVVQTRIESVKRSDIRRTGIRVYDGDCIGVAGALGSFDADDLRRKAEKALSRGVSYPWEISGGHRERISVPSGLPDEATFVSEMEVILRELRERHPELIFSNNGKLVDMTVAMENDRALDLEYRAGFVSFGFGWKHRDSCGIMDGFSGSSGFVYSREGVLEDLCRPCEAYGRLVDLPPGGRLPVIFSCEDQLLLSKLRGDLNGRLYGSGSSLLAGRAGEKVFSDLFSLTQTADHTRRAQPFFDAEGTVNDGYRYPLITDGTVKAAYTDRRTADRFSLPHTGCAGAGYDSVPGLAPAGLRIEDTGRTLAELLDGDQGILVAFSAGGDYTPEGRFATPVQLAFLHDGERLTGRLPGLNISSDVFSMFGSDYRGCSTDSISVMSEDRHVVMVMDVEKTD
jgi:PmbA protein